MKTTYMIIGEVTNDNAYMYGDSNPRDAFDEKDRKEANMRTLLSNPKYSCIVVIRMKQEQMEN